MASESPTGPQHSAQAKRFAMSSPSAKAFGSPASFNLLHLLGPRVLSRLQCRSLLPNARVGQTQTPGLDPVASRRADKRSKTGPLSAWLSGISSSFLPILLL